MALRRSRTMFGSWLKPSYAQGEIVCARQLPVNVSVTPEQITLTAHLPGFTADQIDVRATANGVTISTHRPAESTAIQRVRHEVYEGNWFRRVRLPHPVRPDQAVVTDDNGVLTISLPRVPAQRSILGGLPGGQALDHIEIPLRSSADVADLGLGPTGTVFKS